MSAYVSVISSIALSIVAQTEGAAQGFPKYPNTPLKEEMCDAPFVVQIDDTICFLFMVKDGNMGNPLNEMHCLAIYDISDSVKRYEMGERFTPNVNDCGLFCGYDLLCPPLTPDPTNPYLVPNQVYYHHFEEHDEFGDEFRYWIVQAFENPGERWMGCGGLPITPRTLGYQPGQTITFRLVLLGEEGWAEGNNDIHHLQDLRVKVCLDREPMPKLAGWPLVDLHYHSWNTNNDWEYGAPLEYVAKVARRVGLDCIVVTDHSCNLENELTWPDGYSGMSWWHLTWETGQYDDILLIRGEEVSCHRDSTAFWAPWHINNERHFLILKCGYIKGDFPPGIGITNYELSNLLSGGPPPDGGNDPENNVRAQGGFAYMAHPGSYAGDNLSPEVKSLMHRSSVFKGFEIFNCRDTHKSSDPLHAWGEDNPALGQWEEQLSNWDSEMLYAVTRYDGYLSEYLSKGNPNLRKIFIVASSDAHGHSNYAAGKEPFPGGLVDESAFSTHVGCFRTAVSCPYGLQHDSVLKGLRDGRAVATDGPVCIFGVDNNGDGDIDDQNDLVIGDGDDDENGVLDSKCHIIPAPNTSLYVRWKSNVWYGKVLNFTVTIGDSASAQTPTVKYYNIFPTSYDGDTCLPMKDLMYCIDDGPTYMRVTAYSQRSDTFGHTYRCWTNPIWIYRHLPRITEVSVTPPTFDATEESTIVHFHVEDYPGYITFTIGNIKFLEEQYLQPGEYNIVWQGREDTTSTSRVIVPGSYCLNIKTSGVSQHMSYIIVKGTMVSGVIGTDVTWTEAGEPYVMTDDVTLGNEVDLQIDSGVKVMPRGWYCIEYHPSYYNASLVARGTVANEVQFTPHRKILPVADPVPHHWKGIRFHSNYEPTDSLILEHCLVEAAGVGGSAIISNALTNAPVTMINTRFVDCDGYVYSEAEGRNGVYLSSVTVDSCLFEDNDSLMIMSFSSFKSIVGNSFTNNKSKAIRLMTSKRWDSGVIESNNAYYLLLKRTNPYNYVSSIASRYPSYCATLTIKPGTTLLFEDSAQLSTHHQSYFRGKIAAIGEAQKPIVFSAADTTKPWTNILVDNPTSPSDTSEFGYCEFSYAGTCLHPSYDSTAVCLSDVHRPLVVRNSVFRRNRGYGLNFRGRWENLSVVPEITDNQFIENSLYPLRITSNCVRDFSGNTFSGNNPNEILVVPDNRVNHDLVWWNQGVPYRISVNNLVVRGLGDTTVLVQVEPGNILKFERYLKLSVEDSSQLLAQGVTFTSIDSCSVWCGLSFRNASHDTSCIDSCHIENAENHSTLEGAGITIGGKTNLRVVNSKIDSNDVGIRTRGINNNDNPWIWISGNEITQNRKHGIWIQEWDWTWGTGYHYIRHNKIWRNDTGMVHSVGNDSRTIRADSNWWGDDSGPNDQSLSGPDYNPNGQGDTIGDWIQYRMWTKYLPPIGSIAVNGDERFTNSPFCILNLTSQNPNTIDSLPADSMMIWQFRLVQGQPVKDSTGWIPYAKHYAWRLRQNEGINTVHVRYMIDEDTLKSPEYRDSIYVDWTSPDTLEMVINRDSLFASGTTCTLCCHAVDTASGIQQMRFGNDSLVNLVHNSDMAGNTHWFYNCATYHDSLDLFELTIAEDTNYFYQRIWSDSILVRDTARYDGDTMRLNADVVIDHFKGNGRLEARCVYYNTPMMGWPDSITVVPEGASIVIPETTASRTSRYNLSSHFKFTADTTIGFDNYYLHRIEVGLFVTDSETDTGRIWVDNVRLEPVGPQYDFARFTAYDTTKLWNLRPVNGRQVVFAQYSDSAGNETACIWDTIVLDTTHPSCAIWSPCDSATISDTLWIFGYAYDPSDTGQYFWKYNLDNRPFEGNWQPVIPDSVSYTPVNFGPFSPPLGRWNTYSVSNGRYDLRVLVKDSARNQAEDTVFGVYVSNQEGPGGGDGFGGFGGEGEGMCLDSAGNLYIATTQSIADQADLRIRKYSPKGESLLAFSARLANDSTGIPWPSNLAVDDSARIWLVDGLNHCLKIFDSTGKLIRKIGTYGTKPGQFKNPLGISLRGKVYVADPGNRRAQVFSRTGQYLKQLGLDSVRVNNPLAIVPNQRTKETYILDLNANNAGEIFVYDTLGKLKRIVSRFNLSKPTGMTVDDRDNIFIADAGNKRILELSPYLTHLYSFGKEGDSLGQFRNAKALTVTRDGRYLYVYDGGKKKIAKFNMIRERKGGKGGVQTEEIVEIIPMALTLFAPRPNPTRGCITVRYGVPRQEKVSLIVFDIIGREVKAVVNRVHPAGFYSAVWDGRDNRNRRTAAGVYFLLLRDAEKRVTKKVVVVK